MNGEFTLEDWMDRDWLHIVMHFPNTKELRQPGCNPRLLRAAADDAAIRQAEFHGYTAGNHLMLQYMMHHAPWGARNPSNRMIIYIMQRYAKERFSPEYRSRPKPVTSQKIYDYRKEFRPVAHLWAALRLHEELTGAAYGYWLLSADSDSITQFLGSAASIQEFGLKYIQDSWKGPRETLLDPDDIWRIPNSVQRLRPRWPEIPPDWLLRAIETYRAS